MTSESCMELLRAVSARVDAAYQALNQGRVDSARRILIRLRRLLPAPSAATSEEPSRLLSSPWSTDDAEPHHPRRPTRV